jgi:hypothetical protein
MTSVQIIILYYASRIFNMPTRRNEYNTRVTMSEVYKGAVRYSYKGVAHFINK